MLRKVHVQTDPESLADIPAEQYHDMLESLIADHFGADEEGYSFSFTIGSPSRVSVLADDGENESIVETIHKLCETAFSRCCAGLPVPD